RRTHCTRSEGAHSFIIALAESKARARRDFIRCHPAALGALLGSVRANAGALDCPPPIAPLFAHRTECARKQSQRVPLARGHGERDGQHPSGNRGKATGHPERLARPKSELAAGIGRSDGGCDGQGLASMEGALAELDPASALLERKSVRGLVWRGKKLALQCRGFVSSSVRNEGVNNALEGCGRPGPAPRKRIAMNGQFAHESPHRVRPQIEISRVSF